MWLYSFQGRYGHDKICRSEQPDLSVGDLMIGQSDMYLILGDEVSWTTDKSKVKCTEELTLDHKGFFSKTTIELIHRLVHEYYTSYKNVVKLFASGELADLFKKQVTVKKKVEQKLIVYPDVRTMDNLSKNIDVSDKGVAMLNSSSTQQQKDKARWGIKMGHIHTLLCTPSEIFLDRKDLKSITLIDSHQRYYKSQQDPRYDTREFVKKMAEVYGADIVLEGISIF